MGSVYRLRTSTWERGCHLRPRPCQHR